MSFSLDTVGPIAWTVRDCALLLQAIAGHDASDPASISEPVPDYTATLSTDLAGVRIGHVRQFYREDAADDVIEGIEAAIKVMADLGAVVSEVELPQLSLYNACTRVLVQSEAYAIHSSRLRQNETGYNSVTRARLMLGATISAEEYINCQRLRRKLLDRTVAAMDEVDVLVTAIQYEAPIFISEDSIYPYFGKPALATPFNVTGQPALAICCGFGKEGMPLSLQIAGRHFEEALVLKVGYAYESATPWRERRPVFTEQRRAQRISGREP